MRRILPVITFAMATFALAGCGMFRDAEAPRSQVTLRVADAALASGAPELALRIANVVLEQQPDNTAALVARGDALYALGASDQARVAYRMAVAADSKDVGAQIGLGRTLIRSDPAAAEQHFRAALDRQPDNVIALNNLGIARDMQGHHAEAQQAYRQALSLAPEMTDVKTNLGLSLALSGQGQQAVPVLQPIATAPEATPMKRADLAVAMAQARGAGPTGPVKEQAVQAATARFDAEPIAVRPAPIASVESQPLQPHPVEKVAKPEVAVIRPAPPRQTGAVADGIYVQVASLDSEQAAHAEWQRLRARWPDLLGAHAPTVTQADVHDRTFWRLRTTGFASLGEADAFCTRLKAGGSGCWTVGLLGRL